MISNEVDNPEYLLREAISRSTRRRRDCDVVSKNPSCLDSSSEKTKNQVVSTDGKLNKKKADNGRNNKAGIDHDNKVIHLFRKSQINSKRVYFFDPLFNCIRKPDEDDSCQESFEDYSQRSSVFLSTRRKVEEKNNHEFDISSCPLTSACSTVMSEESFEISGGFDRDHTERTVREDFFQECSLTTISTSTKACPSQDEETCLNYPIPHEKTSPMIKVLTHSNWVHFANSPMRYHTSDPQKSYSPNTPVVIKKDRENFSCYGDSDPKSETKSTTNACEDDDSLLFDSTPCSNSSSGRSKTVFPICLSELHKTEGLVGKTITKARRKNMRSITDLDNEFKIMNNRMFVI